MVRRAFHELGMEDLDEAWTVLMPLFSNGEMVDGPKVSEEFAKRQRR